MILWLKWLMRFKPIHPCIKGCPQYADLYETQMNVYIGEVGLRVV